MTASHTLIMKDYCWGLFERTSNLSTQQCIVKTIKNIGSGKYS